MACASISITSPHQVAAPWRQAPDLEPRGGALLTDSTFKILLDFGLLYLC